MTSGLLEDVAKRIGCRAVTRKGDISVSRVRLYIPLCRLPQNPIHRVGREVVK
jgi:hypothetical protein